MCAADFVDKWCCSRRPPKGTLVESSDSTKLHRVGESNVSVYGKGGFVECLDLGGIDRLVLVVGRPKRLLISG